MVSLISILSILIFLLCHVNSQIPFQEGAGIKCRKECLNKGGNFCATNDFNNGQCCSYWDTEKCSFAKIDNGYCSSDLLAPEVDLGLKYWVCPRDPICQEMTLIAQQD